MTFQKCRGEYHIIHWSYFNYNEPSLKYLETLYQLLIQYAFGYPLVPNFSLSFSDLIYNSFASLFNNTGCCALLLSRKQLAKTQGKRCFLLYFLRHFLELSSLEFSNHFPVHFQIYFLTCFSFYLD